VRLTEAISFLRKNYINDDSNLFTHIYVIPLKAQMKVDKEFRQFVRQCREQYKSRNVRKTEVIDLFGDLGI